MPWEDCLRILLDRAVRRLGLDKLVADLSLANRQLVRGRNPDERRAARQEKSRPIIGALEPWLREKLALISQKTKLAEAIRYALPRWDGLTRSIDDGCAGPGARVPSGMDPASSCASGANLCFSEAVAHAVQRFDHLEIGIDNFELFA